MESWKMEGKGGGGCMWWEYYVLLCEYGKMKHVETIPGMARAEIKENDGGVNLTMRHCKNICKCHNVLPVQ
jgi:hypothetical protein